MDYYYRFCGVVFRVRAARELWEDEQSARFRVAPCAPDVDITLDAAPELPVPEGARKRGERWTHCDGKTVERLTRDTFRALPHLRTRYARGDVRAVELTARGDCWRWATRSQFLWPGAALPQLLLPFRVLTFHASYIGTDGGAVLFTAPSQTGKSTQAALWERTRGARVLNGDKAAVRLGEVPTAHGLPFSGTSGICENVSLPLRCVVVLSQARENTARRLGATEALRLLAPNVFADMSVETEWRQTLSLLLDLVSAVPVYALACTPDEGAVRALEQALAREEGQ